MHDYTKAKTNTLAFKHLKHLNLYILFFYKITAFFVN